nr:uncharacterized protein LOC124810829 [Hydra vulgaris]
MKDFTICGHTWKLGMSRDNAEQYKRVCKTEKKFSTAAFKNCVQNQLQDLPDDTPISEIFFSMELHIFFGNTNRMYNISDKMVSKKETLVLMNMWNKATWFNKPNLHWGQFKGG